MAVNILPNVLRRVGNQRKRERAGRGVGKLLGIPTRPRGRPKGSYKNKMPIQKFKRLQARRRAQLKLLRQQQDTRLLEKGFSPEQIQALKQAKIIKERKVSQFKNVADEEFAMQQFVDKNSITPNTERILTEIRRTQLKAQRDDMEQQRRHREKKLVANQTSLLATPYVFKDHSLDMTGVKGDNILMAPSSFKEKSEDFILKQKRLNVLQTSSSGNNLQWF